MTVTEKLSALRKSMQQNALDAYIIPSSDPHQSEYVAPHWEARSWLSGFTGSAGILVITMDHAGIWTDSRYYIQAEKQLEGTPLVLHRQGPARGPEHLVWLGENLPEGATVGIDGMLFSLSQNRTLVKILHQHKLELEIQHDLLPSIWPDRPPLPAEAVFEIDQKFTGKSRAGKLAEIRTAMSSQDASQYLISALDEIAWTFNLRGRDIDFNPVFLAYAIIEKEQAILFVNPEKINDQLKDQLVKEGVFIKDYKTITNYLSTLSPEQTLLIDKATTSIGLYQHLKKDNIKEGNSIVRDLKGVKNPTEIENIRQAMRYDGVALTRLYRWLDKSLATGTKVTEAGLADQLTAFRSEQPGYYGESFPAIVGYQGNGAIVHYRPEHSNAATIRAEGLLLLDSGGQYHSGTTDITRTTALGPVTADQRYHYTLVLKGHIGVAALHYPEGTKGYQVDTLARQALWKAHLDYGHGTGHGVGFFLNVHEGPQSISASAGRGGVALQPGMLTSNEPGFYRPGEYGIRIENLVLTTEAGQSDFGHFLKFETLSYFPIDLSLVDKALLTADEIQWLNDYHKKVFEELSPLLEEEEVAWLKDKCKFFD